MHSVGSLNITYIDIAYSHIQMTSRYFSVETKWKNPSNEFLNCVINRNSSVGVLFLICILE